MGEAALGTHESRVQDMLVSWVFISIFNCEDRKGSGKKNQEAEVVFLSRPWLIWGEGALPGSVTHFLPQPEVCFHYPYCP